MDSKIYTLIPVSRILKAKLRKECKKRKLTYTHFISAMFTDYIATEHYLEHFKERNE